MVAMCFATKWCTNVLMIAFEKHRHTTLHYVLLQSSDKGIATITRKDVYVNPLTMWRYCHA